MIPKFASQTDMIGFLRALPQNANYRNMLAKDFNYNVPEDAEAHQVEYFFKYLVQGQYKGLVGKELEQYAVSGTNKAQNTYFVHLKPQYEKKVVAVGKRQPRVNVPKLGTGTIVFNDNYKKYDGYVDGKVVSRAASVERVKACLTARYQVTEFEVK